MITMKYKEEQFYSIIKSAMELFNEMIPGQTKADLKTWAMDKVKELDEGKLSLSDCPLPKELTPFYPFTLSNTVIAFFTPETGHKVYLDFCRKYFPRKLDKQDDLSDERFFSTGAEAFIGRDVNGIMLRSDLDESPEEYRHIVLHELAHIFCTRTEMPVKEHFADIYLGSTTEEQAAENVELDGYINAGYTVWREFIAEDIAYNIDPCGDQWPLKSLRADMRSRLEMFDLLSDDLTTQKQCMSMLLCDIMTSTDVLSVYGIKGNMDEQWKSIQNTLDAMKLFPVPKQANERMRMLVSIMNQSFYEMVYEVFNQAVIAHDDAFEWNITTDFITILGQEYVSFRGARMLLKQSTTEKSDE